jgi:DNA helicase HerA-like ATPase
MARFLLCLNCGRIAPERLFCTFCHSLLISSGLSDAPENREGIYLGQTEDGKSFFLPLSRLCFHLAFYGVTGTGKTRAAMNLAIQAENQGIALRIIDVEGEWKRIIPKLKKETLFYDSGSNPTLNPFEVNDPGLTLLLLKETIFMGVEKEYRELSPQMSYVLGKCVLQSRSIPELIDRVIHYQPKTPFPFQNLHATKTALLTRLNPFKDNPILRKIFYQEHSSLDVSQIEGKNLIVDLHDLDRRVAYKAEERLLYNAITLTYLREALSKPEKDKAENLFIADEAQLLVPKILHKAIVTDTWATTDFATRLRKRGEALAIITQSPSNIEEDIRKNAQNIFIFRLQDAEDIRLIAGMLGCLEIDEVSYFSSLLSSLETRKALVKMPSLDKPLLLTSPTTEL